MHENRKEEEKEKKGENSVRLGNRTRPLIGDICASVFASSSCLVEFGSGSSHGLDFWLLFFFFFFFSHASDQAPFLSLFPCIALLFVLYPSLNLASCYRQACGSGKMWLGPRCSSQHPVFQRGRPGWTMSSATRPETFRS